MMLTCRMNIAEGVLGPYVPMNKQIKRINLYVQSESDDLLVKRQNDNTCCCISFCCQSPQGAFFSSVKFSSVLFLSLLFVPASPGVSFHFVKSAINKLF